MSPELETLDQLQGGELPLAVIRQVYPDSFRFQTGMLGLLQAGEIRLCKKAVDVPNRRWEDVLAGNLDGFKVSLTNAGTTRIA